MSTIVVASPGMVPRPATGDIEVPAGLTARGSTAARRDRRGGRGDSTVEDKSSHVDGLTLSIAV
ncbi:hypothetical protein ACIGNX_29520 [Actinosynnema sp. NPDC053489]|uniref:hypothetical protein n=1 Tax=Actinosynnema sp. NPDC053489 TaxID=3363916 RepID=UPI0037C8E877